MLTGGLAHKYYTRIERLTTVKHSSLFVSSVKDRKKVYNNNYRSIVYQPYLRPTDTLNISFVIKPNANLPTRYEHFISSSLVK